MKRCKLLSVLLCGCMLLSLTACRHKTKDDTLKNTEPTSSVVQNNEQTKPTNPTESIPDFVLDENGNKTTIRHNGKLPNDVKKLTEEETYYYIEKVLKAAVELDIQTLKEYASNENDIAAFEEIAANETHKDLYLKTIGKTIFLEDSHFVVYKDPFYFYSRWFNDAIENGDSTIVSEISTNVVNSIYNKYYSSAPYVADKIYAHEFDFEIKNGCIYFEMDGILNIIGYKSVKDLFPVKKTSYAYILFGTNRENIVDASVDGASRNREILDIIASGDLDKMVEYIDSNKNYNLNDENKDLTYDECYQLYYKEAQLRKEVKRWMNDNVEIYGSQHGVVTYIKANVLHKNNWPFNTFTAEEKSIIKDLPIHIRCVTYEIGTVDEWAQYYLIIEQMIYNGAITDLYAY